MDDEHQPYFDAKQKSIFGLFKTIFVENIQMSPLKSNESLEKIYLAQEHFEYRDKTSFRLFSLTARSDVKFKESGNTYFNPDSTDQSLDCSITSRTHLAMFNPLPRSRIDLEKNCMHQLQDTIST